MLPPFSEMWMYSEENGNGDEHHFRASQGAKHWFEDHGCINLEESVSGNVGSFFWMISMF